MLAFELRDVTRLFPLNNLRLLHWTTVSMGKGKLNQHLVIYTKVSKVSPCIWRLKLRCMAKSAEKTNFSFHVWIFGESTAGRIGHLGRPDATCGSYVGDSSWFTRQLSAKVPMGQDHGDFVDPRPSTSMRAYRTLFSSIGPCYQYSHPLTICNICRAILSMSAIE